MIHNNDIWASFTYDMRQYILNDNVIMQDWSILEMQLNQMSVS